MNSNRRTKIAKHTVYNIDGCSELDLSKIFAYTYSCFITDTGLYIASHRHVRRAQIANNRVGHDG